MRMDGPIQIFEFNKTFICNLKFREGQTWFPWTHPFSSLSGSAYLKLEQTLGINLVVKNSSRYQLEI